MAVVVVEWKGIFTCCGLEKIMVCSGRGLVYCGVEEEMLWSGERGCFNF